MRPAEDIDKLIKKLRYKASAETHDRVLGNVLQALDKSEKETSGVTTPNIWRTIMKNPIAKLAAAAVIIIAVLFVVYQFGGSIESSAFAQVANKLRSAITLTYTATTNSQVEIEMAFKEPGYMRTTMPGGLVTVIDWAQGKGISILPSRKQFIEMEMSNLPHDPAQHQFNVIEKLRTLPDRADEELGTSEIDGWVLQGFRVTEEDVINTVWIDPQTRDLVRVETEFINTPGMNVVMTDFQFDVDLDDSLFSLTPPAGYTRIEVQADVSEVTEQDLIEYLRAWSSWTKDGTFPPTFNPMELQKVSMEMEQQGKFGDGQTTEQQRERDAITIYRGIMFLTQLPAESNWRYAGEDVKFGDTNTAIFWYRPEGSETYRVIYGDLSVKDVAPGNLPK